MSTPAPYGDRLPTPEEARADALRGIAAAAVRARAAASRSGRMPLGIAEELLVEVERQLSALIVVGAVPGPPDPNRRPLT